MTTLDRLNKFFKSAPKVASSAYVSPHAVVIGDVTIGAKSSIWPSVVLRADINSIEIGKCSNIQDGTMVHLADDYGVKIGDFTTVGHGAILHACEIGDETLIGMGATVLDGAKVGNQCVIGACSLVTKGMIVPDGSVVMGVPGKIVKTMDADARSKIRTWAEKYLKVAQTHKEYFESLGYKCSGNDDSCESSNTVCDCECACSAKKSKAKKSKKSSAKKSEKKTLKAKVKAKIKK